MANRSNLELRFRELGQGEPIVFLHGYGGSPANWNQVTRELAKKFRVITPDLSEIYTDISKQFTFRQQVSALSDFVSKIGDGKPVNIAASSYGGALAWGIAITSPHLVEGLVLLSPMPPHPQSRIRNRVLKQFLFLGRWPKLLWLYLKSPLGRRALPRIAEIFQFSWALQNKMKSKRFSTLTIRQIQVLTHVIYRFSWILRLEDWSFWESRLQFIQSPICLIWGQRDMLFNQGEPERMQKIFEDCQLHSIANTGHLSMRDNPAPVVQIIQNFLEKKAA